MLKVMEHESSSYRDRTIWNAKNSDLTVAFAINFDTHGEILTRKAAGKKYLAIPLDTPIEIASDMLKQAINRTNAKVINIAGHSAYTLQKLVDYEMAVDISAYIYNVLKGIPHEISMIRCGGQSGADLAGAVAAWKLGIPCEVMMPKGRRIKDENGIDIFLREGDFELVVKYAASLKIFD